MNVCYIQVRSGCMQNYEGSIGSCEDDKLLDNISSSVHPANAGELNLRSRRWQTCHHSACGFSVHLFYSTGVDCFGPYLLKIGRRTEKRWGAIFKCFTTRGIHIKLLNSLDVDAFFLALRRFIARRGRPKELHSDRGTNFRGAEREREVFAAMEPQLKEQLTEYQIDFKFNPPSAPHFGGVWERGPFHKGRPSSGSWEPVSL